MSVSGASDTEVLDLVVQGFRQFSVDVGGIPAKEFLALTPYFTPRAVQGVHLKITGSTNNDVDKDISIAGSSAQLIDGTAMAALLQTIFRDAIGPGADLTVAWADFAFTVDTIDATSIEITAATSVNLFNAVGYYFGGEITGTTSAAGKFPTECTMFVDTPHEVLGVNHITWNERYLIECNQPGVFLDPIAIGDPSEYRIYLGKIMITPNPTSQERFDVMYKMVLDVSSLANDTNIIDPPEWAQEGIIDWVAAQLLYDSHEDERAVVREAKYQRERNKYKQFLDNQNPIQTEKGTGTVWYRVEVD